ncbi:MAG: hypothetical protein GXP46_06030 [Deferribacteres bacterium]|nr:hypothetical protein [Deferribacteres bacterium]
MVKRILLVAVLSIMIFEGAAYAARTDGEIIFRDTLYGTAIGAIIGTAVYLVEQKHFGPNLAAGILVGSVGGMVYGFAETDSLIELKNDEIKFALPTPTIRKEENGILYSASILKARF